MAQCGKKWLASMFFGGISNTKIFGTWLKKVLLKELRPNQTIIMDNTAIHKNQKTIK